MLDPGSGAFECVLSDRDYDASDGKLKTTCFKVGKDANERLRKRERESDTKLESFKWLKMSAPSSHRAGRNLSHEAEALTVAWTGPIPAGKWKSHY